MSYTVGPLTSPHRIRPNAISSQQRSILVVRRGFVKTVALLREGSLASTKCTRPSFRRRRPNILGNHSIPKRDNNLTGRENLSLLGKPISPEEASNAQISTRTS